MMRTPRRMHRSCRWLCALVAGSALVLATTAVLAQTPPAISAGAAPKPAWQATSNTRKPVGSRCSRNESVSWSRRASSKKQSHQPGKSWRSADACRETITGRR